VKLVVLNAAVALLVSAVCLLAYDRWVFRPAQLIGVVDVADVYRAKEAEFAALLTAGGSDDDRVKAMELATRFARRLPQALDELPVECRCLVVMKSALAGSSANTVDLTARLRAKLDAKS
jgi:hypothetical protein